MLNEIQEEVIIDRSIMIIFKKTVIRKIFMLYLKYVFYHHILSLIVIKIHFF